MNHEKLTATALAAQTPTDRNRYIDALRVLAIGAVVIGHWLMALIWMQDGELIVGGVEVPFWALLLTWPFQVMPVFFMVGGFSNAASWRSAVRRGDSHGVWLRTRARRLLQPTTWFLATWVLLAVAAGSAGVNGDDLATLTQAVAAPVWFLGVYLAVVALTPKMHELHLRYRAAVPLVLVAVAIGIDLASRGVGLTALGWANFLPVWLAVHQIGFFWQDGSLHKARAHALRVAGAATAGLIVATFAGPYPVAMVGLPGSGGSNNTPPTVLMVVLAIAQLGLALAAEARAQRWLQRPRVWVGVVTASSVQMTVYLWHIAAAAMVIGVLVALGSPMIGLEPMTATWWEGRPIWLGVATLALLPLVLIFRRVERPAAVQPGSGTPSAVIGALLAAAGLSYFARFGLYTPGLPAGLPLAGLIPFAAGLWLLGWGTRQAAVGIETQPRTGGRAAG